MIRPEGGLAAINLAIGDAEASADRAFFERLLAPAFSMGRPDGVRFDDRATFLDSLTVSPPRQTRIESTTMFDNRAVVVCAVSKTTPAGAQYFRNIRVFTQSDGAGWQLVAWVNEPLAALGIAGDGGVAEGATPVGGARCWSPGSRSRPDPTGAHKRTPTFSWTPAAPRATSRSPIPSSRQVCRSSAVPRDDAN